MNENKDLNENETLDIDEEGNISLVKIIITIFVLVVAAVVGFSFYKLYGSRNENNSSEQSSKESSGIYSSQNPLSEDASDTNSQETSEILSSEIVSNLFEESSEESFSESSEDISEEVSQEPEHGWVINQMGYTYLYQGAGFNQFNGTSSLAQKYANALNKLTNTVSFPVYSIIAPTSVEFVDIPYDVKQADDFYNSSQKTFISKVNASSSATAVDVYSSIAENVKNEYLYFRTDKNWTVHGAYLAYVQFCNATGNTPVEKTDFEKGSYEGYLGNFYNATSSQRLKANADAVDYYKINELYPCGVTMYRGGLAYKDRALIYTQLSNPISYGYYAFLGDRGESFTIKSDNSACEKSILVVGDSSAFAFVPFLAANYRNIYFVNAESFNGKISEYISQKNIDEAVVLSYATSTVTQSFVHGLENIAQ